MNPGDVFWVEFPSGVGRAQAGRRPAIMVQTDEASRAIPTALVIPLTTQQDALRFPGTVLVEADPQNGLKRPSVALVFQLTAIDRRYFGAMLGSVSAEVLHSIWAAFDDIAGRTQH